MLLGLGLSLIDFTASDEPRLPIYRQLADCIAEEIKGGRIAQGDRLPATRELAGQLGLNRSTVASAYGILEEAGMIAGHVGRGSFVSFAPDRRNGDRPSSEVIATTRAVINFASSRPAAEAFPLGSFRKFAQAVIEGPEISEILQLGSPQGYGPLRRYLLELDRSEGIARPDDDVLITNGCQQALDLMARAYAAPKSGSPPPVVLVEDPVYHGLLRVFEKVGARLLPIPVGPGGIDVGVAEDLMDRYRPRLLVVTPDFQNPTGVTMGLSDRHRLLAAATRAGVLVIENGIYSPLRYAGSPLPPLKQLDESGRGVLLRSYSKVSFPGLRVGWVTAPRDVIRRLAEEKQIADLHSDQLAQAIFLRFAQSGELQAHIARSCIAGRKRLESVFRACEQSWPENTHWTRPEGGMNFWVELPATLSTDTLWRRGQSDGVEFLPGTNFSVHGGHRHALRISFGGLAPEAIERGIRVLGNAAKAELANASANLQTEPAVALV